MTRKRHALEWSDGAAGPFLATLADEDGPGAWQDYALCAETDSELFFPEKGGSTREPKAVCAQCFVREPCLAYALDNAISHGIWGGKSDRERRKILQGRRAA
jgi:WhiB family redox-sensing transcriptional regulator